MELSVKYSKGISGSYVVVLPEDFFDKVLSKDSAIEILSPEFVKIDNIVYSIADILAILEHLKQNNDIQFKGIYDKLLLAEMQHKANAEAISIFKQTNDNKFKNIENQLFDMNNNNNVFWRAFQIITFATALAALLGYIILNNG